MQLTVQLPPTQFLPPLASVLDDGHVDGVEDDDRVFSMRRVDAASIQWPFQPARAQLGEDFGGVVAALP